MKLWEDGRGAGDGRERGSRAITHRPERPASQLARLAACPLPAAGWRRGGVSTAATGHAASSPITATALTHSDELIAAASEGPLDYRRDAATSALLTKVILYCTRML